MYIINQHGIDTSMNSFVFTINTALGTGTTFTLPLPSGQTYDFYWTPYDGATPLHVTAYNDANATYDYGVHGTYNVSVGVNPGDKCGGWSFNNGGDKLKLTSIDQWGNVGFDYLFSAFYGCANLNSVTTSALTLPNANAGQFFRACTSLTFLDLRNWDVSLATGFLRFTSGCTGLTSLNLNGWIMTNCTTISRMVEICTSLTSLDTGNWTFGSSMTNAAGFAENCYLLTTFDVTSWDMSNVTTLAAFVRRCFDLTTINVSGWDVGSVTTFAEFASECNDLLTLDVSSWDMSSATSTYRLARNCTSLVTFDTDLWDTSGITTCAEMCYNCTSLTSSFDNTLWWDRSPSIGTFTDCFTNDTNISNYASIPNGWKGL